MDSSVSFKNDTSTPISVVCPGQPHIVYFIHCVLLGVGIPCSLFFQVSVRYSFKISFETSSWIIRHLIIAIEFLFPDLNPT